MTRIEGLLKKNGPMLSGKLATLYEQAYSATNEAARKAISRERTPVQKIKTFPFVNNQVFCYLEEQYNKDIYRERLYHVLKESSSSIAPILVALENFEGVISKALLPIYSNSPVQNTKGHRLFQRNIEDLIKQGIIFESDEDHFMIDIKYYNKEANIGYSMSNEKICKLIVNDFMMWAAKINLVAYNSTNVYPKITDFAHFQWFSTSPSYVQPVFDISENKNGFFIVDIVYKKAANISDIKFFVDKINIIRHYKRIMQICPVLLVESLTPEAFKYLKENKIVIGIISNIFDKKYAELLADIHNVFRNATTIIMNQPEKIDDLLTSIEKNEGRFNNVVGDLFECMVGLYYQRQGLNYLELNKQIRNLNGSYYEMDVLACQGNKIIITECKAMKSKLSKEYVEKWLSLRLPTFRRWINQTYGDRTIIFQIWSISGFEEDALQLLEEHKKSVKKYSLCFLDKNEIIQLAKDEKDTIFEQQIQKHFSNKIYGRIE